MTRVPIYLVTREVAPGLPPQQTYGFLEGCKHLGDVVVPDGLGIDLAEGYIIISRAHSGSSIVALMPRQAVEAAIAGKFGLTWEATP